MQQLAADAEFAPLHRLLHIMAREHFSDFLAFASASASQAFMDRHALSVSACGDKMRLLTLVSLVHAQKEVRARVRNTPSVALLAFTGSVTPYGHTNSC